MAGMGLVLTALPVVRRRLFELFMYSHIVLMALFFFGAVLHTTEVPPLCDAYDTLLSLRLIHM